MSSKAARAMRRETGANTSLQSRNVSPPPIPFETRTPQDSLLRSCPPPVVVSSESFTSGLNLRLDTSHGKRDAHGDSAGWFSSFLVHAVLIALLALILSPADFGGTRSHPLVVTLSHEVELERVARFEAPAPDDAMQAQPLPAANPPLIEVPLSDAAAMPEVHRAKPGESVNLGTGATGGSSVARGSFFGIEAQGHEFVYVLDMSGSMRGVRFKRATAELVRSVEGLRETQSFYVLLFNGSTVQMFGQSSRRPTPIAATPVNKGKLSDWLTKAFRGGSTDPRGALRLALRMKPSAIFILSDGEFDEPSKNKNKNSSLLEGNSDAFSIVAAASASVPIHAIAFEDPRSCENMKRLAEMTSGEYRFKKSQNEELAKAWLASAREALGRGDNAKAETLMRQTATTFGNTQAGLIARKELAATLFQSAEKAIQEGRLEAAKEFLLQIVTLDPQADSTADFQNPLIAELLRRSRQNSGRADASVISMLAEIVDRFPNSKATQQIVEPVADAVLEEARELAANDKPGQSLLKLETILRKYPNVPATQVCRVEQQKIIDDFLEQAEDLRRTQDVVASAKYLRSLVAEYDVQHLDNLATRALEELAVELLVRLRDANHQRDWTTRNDTNRQLEEGFSGHATLLRAQREVGSKELQARDLLRRANRFERIAQMDSAIKRYLEIVENLPETLAAKKAQSRLDVLKPKLQSSSQPDEISAEMFRMMQQ